MLDTRILPPGERRERGSRRAFLPLLGTGLRLALTLRAPSRPVPAGPAAVLLLGALLAAASLAIDYLLVPAPHEPAPWSLALDGARAFAALLALYLASLALGRGGLERLLGLVLAAALLPLLVARVWMTGYPPAEAMPDGAERWLPVAWFVWLALVLVRALAVALPAAPARRAGAALLLVGGSALVIHAIPSGPAWVPSEAPDAALETPVAAPIELDVEAVYYAQADRLEGAIAALAAQRPGVTDVYFVGFAGHAGQDVFVREVRHLRAFADRRLGTEGRSLLLVNHPDTVDALPIASAHNLERALAAVGEIMDPGEDVLFVYLTSHGSEGGRIDVEFGDLGLADLTAERLARALGDSGARWRIVALSACYSGGFLDALAGPSVLVMTASRADRTSFGCSNERDFTYFGEALREALDEGGGSLLDAFPRLQARIGARERREGLTPSLPQLRVGDEMAEKLRALAAPPGAG